VAKAERAPTEGTGEAVQPGRPRIVLEFAATGMADILEPTLDGVTLGQVYAAAWYLDALARELFQGEQTRRALAAMAPGSSSAVADILAQLRRDQPEA
jgi:hypothetical protein